MSDRRYDEREVGEILQKAAELQVASGVSPQSEGTSLAELRRVAEEVGIDPALISQAAKEFDGPKSVPAGKSDSVLFEMSLDTPLSDESWEEMVTEMRRFVGRPGTDETKGNHREWIGGWEIGYLSLSATTRGGRTKLKLLGDTSGLAVGAWLLGSCISAMTALGIVAKSFKLNPAPAPIVTATLAIGTIVTMILAITVLLKLNRKKFGRRMDILFASLVQHIESESPATEKLHEADAQPALEVRLFDPGL